MRARAAPIPSLALRIGNEVAGEGVDYNRSAVLGSFLGQAGTLN